MSALQALTVSYKDFDPANLVFESPQSQTSKAVDPKTKQPVQYMTLPFKYRYTYTDSKGVLRTAIGELLMDLPEISSEKGIVISNQEDKEKGTSRVTSTIPVVFDLRNPDIADFASDADIDVKDEKGNPKLDAEGRQIKRKRGAIYRYHTAVVEQMLKVSDRITVGGYGSVTSIDAMNGQFYQTLYWSKTGRHVEGQNPSKFFDLVNYGKQGSVFQKQTLFTLPSTDEKELIDAFPDPKSVDAATGKATKTRFPGGKIPWDYLISKTIKFIPLIRFKPVFIGQKASEKFEVESAVVTDIVNAGSVTKQSKTIDALKSTKPSLMSTLQSQIAMLSIDGPSFRQAAPETQTTSTSAAATSTQGTLGASIAALTASVPAQESKNATPLPAADTHSTLLPPRPDLSAILSSGPTLTSASNPEQPVKKTLTLNLPFPQ
jgi:hypothetical protein